MRMLRELSALRKNNAVLTAGTTQYLPVGDREHVIAYTREHAGKCITVIVNTADTTIESTVDVALSPAAHPLLQKDFVVTKQDDALHFAAGPGGYMVIEH